MGNRIDLHNILCELIESNHVYFQPPASIEMEYPAIRYSLSNIDNRFANNSVYKQTNSYEIIVIDKDPDSTIRDKVSMLPRIRFNRHYISDNLNHYAFTLTY